MSRPRPPTGSRASPSSPPRLPAAAPTRTTRSLAEARAIVRRKFNKYGNKRTVVDGITFASRKEARRYGELILLQKGRRISGLVCQPVIPLMVAGVRIGKYIGDFAYIEGGRQVIEDTKGIRTPVFNLKWRMVKALCPTVDWRIT